jgi:hypothetical protein
VKKFIIFAAALLMLGFATSSFALQAEIPQDTTAAIAKGGTQVTISGDLRTRGIVQQNTRDFNKHVTDGDGDFANGKPEKMLYDSRVRLGVEAKLSPNTIGFIQMEAAGGAATDVNSEWGSADNPPNTARKDGGTFRYGDQRGANFQVLQAWIQHSGSGLLGVPAYFKVGHQPITIGAGIFYSHTMGGDDAIVLGINPIKGLDFTFLTVKLQENADLSADDQDLYSFIVSYAVNRNITVGFDASLLQSQHGSLDTGGAQFFIAGAKSEIYNLGFNAKANISGFNLKGTFDFQLGNVKAPGNENFDFRGYALTLGANYKFAPVTVGLDFGYGSGDSKWDGRITTFQTSQSNTPRWTFVYDYHTINAAGYRNGGLQNTMFLQLNANADVMKGLNIGGSITQLSAAKKAMGNAGWDDMVDASSKNIGTEIDANLTYQIDKGLKYFVEAGYLFAGNFWKEPMGSTGTRKTDAFKLSDPWVVRHGIQLSF